VGLTEVFLAASGLMNTRMAENGKISGVRRLRNDGHCNAHIRLVNTAGRRTPQDMSPLVH
jgi:hypothetical protein